MKKYKERQKILLYPTLIPQWRCALWEAMIFQMPQKKKSRNHCPFLKFCLCACTLESFLLTCEFFVNWFIHLYFQELDGSHLTLDMPPKASASPHPDRCSPVLETCLASVLLLIWYHGQTLVCAPYLVLAFMTFILSPCPWVPIILTTRNTHFPYSAWISA